MDAMFAGEAAAEASRRLGREVTPREITALFYDRVVSECHGPIVGGRRVIPSDGLDAILAALRDRDAARRRKENCDGSADA